MPEFTKVWSVANIALNKLTARLFTVGVLLYSKKSGEIFCTFVIKLRYSKINKFLNIKIIKGFHFGESFFDDFLQIC